MRPGYIFLFPGSYVPNPPAYRGTVQINCQDHAPMLPGGGTMHSKMCALLDQPAENFIGFSIQKYPWSASNSLHFNSCTCNPRYFGGCGITTCDGHNWQQLIRDTLKTWLG